MSSNVRRSVDEESYDYPTSSDAYILHHQIGSGAFSTVYAAKRKDTDEMVAVKVMNLDEVDTNWDEIRKEISVMRQMKQPNVVPIYCAFVDHEELWMVMPLLSSGSCARIIKEKFPNGIKNDEVVAYILLEALKGLEYFHKDGKIHRDIKAGNILLSDDGQVALADFGVAGALLDQGQRKKHCRTFVGTPCWMAPEVMDQQIGYDQKADIWSFGITAMELAYGRAPYAHFPPMKVLILTLQEDPPTCDIYKDTSFKFSSNFYKMIKQCLKKLPEKRPSAEKLKTHKFFRKTASKEEVIEYLFADLPELGHNSPDLSKLSQNERRQQQNVPVVPKWSFGDLKSLTKKEMEALMGGPIERKTVVDDDKNDSDDEISLNQKSSITNIETPSNTDDQEMSSKMGRFRVTEDKNNNNDSQDVTPTTKTTIDTNLESLDDTKVVVEEPASSPTVSATRETRNSTDSKKKGRFVVVEGN